MFPLMQRKLFSRQRLRIRLRPSRAAPCRWRLLHDDSTTRHKQNNTLDHDTSSPSTFSRILDFLEGSPSYAGRKSSDTLDDPPSLLSIGSIPSTSSLESSSKWCTLPRQQDFLEELTKNWWVINPDLKPFIRPCISGMGHGVDSDDAGRLQTDFSVCFLGTGAGIPSVLRKTSATALRLKGMSYLFDAGEGVQSQIRLSRISMNEICNIFITHLHGDHVFGLPGLLLSIQLAAMARDKPTTVKVYGPVGLYNFIAANLSLSCAELHALQIEVYELRGGSRRKWVHPGTIQNYSEFKNRNLFRKSIPQNKDGTWTLQTAMEITSPEEAEQMNSIDNERGFYVHAAQVSHVPALQCFGYVVQEPLSMPQRVDAERVKAAGAKPGRKYKLLKAGFSVLSDDGLRRVHPEDVIVDGEHIISRKFALLGDCCGVPAPMAELCRDADVLVHEATLLQTDEGRKVERGGHSSASMAGVFADYVNAKVVALNHISSKNRFNAAVVIDEATKAIKGTTTRVQLSYDFLELFVPRTGFPATTTTTTPRK